MTFECPDCDREFDGYRGLKTHQGVNRTDQDVLDDIRRVADELGWIPTEAEFESRAGYGTAAVNRRFGTWTNGLEAAGVAEEYERRKPEQILDDVRAAFEEHDVLRQRDFVETVDYSTGRVRYHFGSWTDTLQAARLPSVDGQRKARLIREVQEVADELDKVPTLDEFREYSGPNLRSAFDTYNDLLRAAGIADRDRYEGRGRTPKEVDVIGDIQAFVDEHGFVPTIEQFNKSVDYSSQTVYNRYDGWEDAVHDAGYTGYSSADKQSESNKGVNAPWYGKERSEQTKKKISEGLKK